jgi:hypothetical protein
MLALVALIVFILALFKVHIGSIDLVILGLAFLAAHFVFTWTPWTAWRRTP